MSYRIRPVTPSRWNDVLALFGERGAYSNCWCTWWRQTSSDFDQGVGGGNRHLFKGLVEEGRVPGLLAYDAGVPVGWCSIAPRKEFGRIARSPNLKPADDLPGALSVVCFFIDRRHRGGGVASALLDGAVEHARKRRARFVEGYPIDTSLTKKYESASLFTGTLSMFLNAGFEEVLRRAPARPVVRLSI